MDEDKREGKEYFQINLDTARIFWISFFFSLILIGVFFLGYFSGGGSLKKFIGGIGREATENAQNVNEQKPQLSEEEIEILKPETPSETKSLSTDEKLISLINKQYKTKTEVIDVEGALESSKPTETHVTLTPKTSEEYTTSARKQVSISGTGSLEKKVIPKITTSSTYRPVGDYYIQVASFTKKDNAEKLAERLRKDMYRVQIIEAEINNKKFYRVRVGPFEKKSVARNTMIAMKRLYGLSDLYVVKQN